MYGCGDDPVLPTKGLLAEREKPAGGIAITDKGMWYVSSKPPRDRAVAAMDDGTRCFEARDIAEREVADVRRRLTDLARIKVALAQLVDRCAAHRGPLLASLPEAT